MGEKYLFLTGSDLTTSDYVAQEIQKEFPQEISNPLIQYVNLVVEDAAQRKHQFSKMVLALRTERHPLGFPKGHSHSGGDLNYAIAPIGANTDVDLKNRFIEIQVHLPEQDYYTTASPQQVLVFGGVWHRTPRLTPGEPRLYVLIELIP